MVIFQRPDCGGKKVGRLICALGSFGMDAAGANPGQDAPVDEFLCSFFDGADVAAASCDPGGGGGGAADAGPTAQSSPAAVEDQGSGRPPASGHGSNARVMSRAAALDRERGALYRERRRQKDEAGWKAGNAERSGRARDRRRHEAQQVQDGLAAAAAELAALRLERAALSRQQQALANLGAYTEEMLDVALAARAAERAREAGNCEGGSASWREGAARVASTFASLLGAVVPPGTGGAIATPSAAQIRQVGAAAGSHRPRLARHSMRAPPRPPHPTPAAQRSDALGAVQVLCAARHGGAIQRRLRIEEGLGGALGGAGEQPTAGARALVYVSSLPTCCGAASRAQAVAAASPLSAVRRGGQAGGAAAVKGFRDPGERGATASAAPAPECSRAARQPPPPPNVLLRSQRIFIRVSAECRVDILVSLAQQVAPPPPSHTAAAAQGPLAGVNPRLLTTAREFPLSPAQRAALLPHWHSFLDETRRMRQELRATLAAISADPAAVGLPLGGPASAQAAARVRAAPSRAPRKHADMRCRPPIIAQFLARAPLRSP
jgi:hypothetical protein